MFPARLSALRAALLALLCGLALWLPHAAMAQERVLQYRPYIDERPWHYGFYLGLHDQSLDLRGTGYLDPTSAQQWVATADRQDFGLSVGLLGNWRLSRTFALRLSPGLHFGSKHIALRNLFDARTESLSLRSTYLSLPLTLKVAAPRWNNHRPYLSLGIEGLYDLTSSTGKPLRTRPLQAYGSVGLGCDFYLPLFKLNPEVRFLFGLHDVLDHRRSDLTEESLKAPTRAVARALPGMIQLLLYFE